MKTIFILICSLFLAVSASAQDLRITINGNQDLEVVVDGRSYDSKNYINGEILLSGLTPGSHSVAIYKTNRRGRAKQLYSSTFTMEADKEVHLSVGSNGSIAREEYTSNAAYGYRTPMSDANFSRLYQSIHLKRGQSARITASRDVFNSPYNYFSTAQVASILKLVNSEAGRLELAKLSYDNVINPDNFSDLYSLLNNWRNRVELETFVQSTKKIGETGRAAMSTDLYNQLYTDINRRNLSARNSTLTTTFNTASYYFTVDQVSRLISLIGNENQRLQLIKLSLDNIVDLRNVGSLFNLLYSQTSRDNLDTYIKNSGYVDGDYEVRTAMSTADFTNLYDEIRRKWLPLSKYSAATDAFRSTTNYYTTLQARQIISLLSSENNRLELAKIAFDNIVDQENFRQLYDLLPTQSNRDELENYIKTVHNYPY